MARPLITVVIPTFNRAPLVGRAIDSVLRQSYDNWELLVVDDGSTDHTQSVVANYYPRVRYLHQPNRGVGAARNNGISQARGELIAMLDSDDEFLPAHLESRLQILLDDANPTDLLTGGVTINGNSQAVDYYDCSRLVDLRDCIMGGCLFGRAEVFRTGGGFNDARYGEDTDFWMRAERRFRVRRIDEPRTYLIHDTPGSLRNERMNAWRGL